MTAVQPHRVHQRVQYVARVALGGAVSLAFTSAAWAQAVQNISIGFAPAGAPISASPVPMSDWASAGIAAIVALTAFFVLRRRGVRGGRFFGAMLAIVAGSTMLSIAGQRVINDAYAVEPVAILNLTSPVVNVAPLSPNVFIGVSVVNNTGASIQITAINLQTGGPYFFNTGSTCFVGLVMSPSTTCRVELTTGQS